MLPDPIDVASQSEQLCTEAAVAAQRLKSAPEQTRNADGSWTYLDCIDCGEPLVEGRLLMGRVRCILCQEELESLSRRGLR